MLDLFYAAPVVFYAAPVVVGAAASAAFTTQDQSAMPRARRHRLFKRFSVSA